MKYLKSSLQLRSLKVVMKSTKLGYDIYASQCWVD
jgi:hypothetical protein